MKIAHNITQQQVVVSGNAHDHTIENTSPLLIGIVVLPAGVVLLTMLTLIVLSWISLTKKKYSSTALS